MQCEPKEQPISDRIAHTPRHREKQQQQADADDMPQSGSQPDKTLQSVDRSGFPEGSLSESSSLKSLVQSMTSKLKTLCLKERQEFSHPDNMISKWGQKAKSETGENRGAETKRGMLKAIASKVIPEALRANFQKSSSTLSIRGGQQPDGDRVVVMGSKWKAETEAELAREGLRENNLFQNLLSFLPFRFPFFKRELPDLTQPPFPIDNAGYRSREDYPTKSSDAEVRRELGKFFERSHSKPPFKPWAGDAVKDMISPLAPITLRGQQLPFVIDDVRPPDSDNMEKWRSEWGDEGESELFKRA